MAGLSTSVPVHLRALFAVTRKAGSFSPKQRFQKAFKTASSGFYFRRNTPSSPADYYRLEVELKAVDGFFIPLDILTNPDSFFAGAAPYFESLVESAPSRLVQPPSDFLQVQTLQSSMEHCSRAYGGLLRSLLELYGDTVETKARLFDALCSQTRLILSSVLAASLCQLLRKKMISVNAINYQASQLIDRALSGRDPDHYRVVLLEWATAFEMLLAAEGAKRRSCRAALA